VITSGSPAAPGRQILRKSPHPLRRFAGSLGRIAIFAIAPTRATKQLYSRGRGPAIAARYSGRARPYVFVWPKNSVGVDALSIRRGRRDSTPRPRTCEIPFRLEQLPARAVLGPASFVNPEMVF